MTRKEAQAEAERLMGSKIRGGVGLRSRSHSSSRYAAGREWTPQGVRWLAFGTSWEEAIQNLKRYLSRLPRREENNERAG